MKSLLASRDPACAFLLSSAPENRPWPVGPRAAVRWPLAPAGAPRLPVPLACGESAGSFLHPERSPASSSSLPHVAGELAPPGKVLRHPLVLRSRLLA